MKMFKYANDSGGGVDDDDDDDNEADRIIIILMTGSNSRGRSDTMTAFRSFNFKRKITF